MEPAAERRVPGHWRCPKCDFLLVRRVLYVKSGTLGEPKATNDVSEPCPNDGTPLEPVTEPLH